MIAAALHLPGYTHRHDHADLTQDAALADSALGIRTVKLALLALGITTVLQFVIYAASGSVALLADTVHNLGDALNSVPLWIALALSRRAATRRYTYGYGRAEDLAGLAIVVSIAFSAVYILWESVQKFIHPQPLDNLGWVAAAALIGFVGNELVAVMQIRVGRQIGSEAMIADGRHARIDGLTSLAVLIAVAGTWLGYPVVDPVIGLLIGVAILFIARDATVAMWHRMMDAVDPALIAQAEAAIHGHPEVATVSRLRMRWVGHRLHAEVAVALHGGLTVAESHAVTGHISHHLYHAIPHLAEVIVSVVPLDAEGRALPSEAAHHDAGLREQAA